MKFKPPALAGPQVNLPLPGLDFPASLRSERITTGGQERSSQASAHASLILQTAGPPRAHPQQIRLLRDADPTGPDPLNWKRSSVESKPDRCTART